MTTRREALRDILGGLAAMHVGCLYAASEKSPRFLLVFLRGGYDCCSLLIPYSSADYYTARPNIAIAKPDPASGIGAIAIDADWALAPAVRTALAPLYARRQLAFVPFAGTDDLSRSHFETQDSIELGQPLGGARDLRSGFLARLAAVLRDSRPIAFTDMLPLVMQGSGTDIPNISLRSVGKPVFDQCQSTLLASLYAGRALEQTVEDGLELRAAVSRELTDEMTAANRNAVSTRGFDVEAARIARMMRADYRIGFVDIGGWDTHVNEGNEQGALATNLGNLASGLSAYAEALGTEWNNTVVVVVSEFGRTFRENGNRGTDHGHGSVYWVLGGGIAGGRICGKQQSVAYTSLFQNRDLPVLNDYRGLLAGLFQRLWGLSPANLERIFPDARPSLLQLV